MTDAPLTTQDVLVRLETRYAPPGWVTIRECSDRTGYRNRTADFIALGIWPSRGLEIIGFEVKSRRGDWLKELKEPEKADPIAVHCDRWYVVVTDPAIIKPGELPADWGLIAPRGAGLKIVVESPYRDKGAVSRPFFMSMMRHVLDGTVAKDLFKQKLDEAFRQREKDLRNDLDWQHKNTEEKLKILSEKVEEFEKVSGVKISNRWESGKDIGEAVRFVLNHRPDEHLSQLKWLSSRLKEIAKDVDLDIENFHIVDVVSVKEEGL